MSSQFQELQDSAAVSLEQGQDPTLSNYPAFKAADFKRSLHCKLLSLNERNWDNEGFQARKVWIEEGLNAEVLNLRSGSWVKGKIRVKVSVEFCPDEPADRPVPPAPDSPLDDVRQSLS